MRRKQGISLIVLVITIIVMIILAATVVIALNNTGIIDKASHAVKLTDEKQVQDLASLAWAEAYLDEKRTDTIENVVKGKLNDQGITDADWNINVTDTGVTVTKKENANNQPINGYTISGTWKFNDTVTLENIEQDVEYSVVIGGTKYYKIKVFYTSESKMTSYIEYVNPNATGGSVSESNFRVYTLYNGNSTWSTGDCETIDFGTTPQEVSEEFYNWFTSNAKEIIEFTYRTSYNGEVTTVECQAEKGMTWSEFASSSYNTIRMVVGSGDDEVYDSMLPILYSDGTALKYSDVIQSGITIGWTHQHTGNEPDPFG